MTMRAIIAFCAALCMTTMHAQTTFAPIGAKWSYKQAYWGGPDTNLMVLEVVSDTLIDGRTCSKVQVHEGIFGCHEFVQYFAESNDSLFKYDQDAGQFDLLFRWNGSLGESWSTPVENSGFLDTLDWIVLDTSHAIIDGMWLRVLNVNVVPRQSMIYSYGGPIMERLGGPTAPFTWSLGVCDGEIFAGLRCYEDADITWQNPLVTQCALGVGIGEREEAGSWIRPSLASRGEPVFITGVEGSMTVIDATGRQLSAQTVRGEQVITFDRPGTYLLRASTALGEMRVGRIQVH